MLVNNILVRQVRNCAICFGFVGSVRLKATSCQGY